MDYCKTTNDRCKRCHAGECMYRYNHYTEPERADIIKQAAKAFSEQNRADMLVEEMAELTKALLKLRRPESIFKKKYLAVQEEIVDVQIMLDQLKIIYGWRDDIEQEKLAKIERLIDDETTKG